MGTDHLDMVMFFQSYSKDDPMLQACGLEILRRVGGDDGDYNHVLGGYMVALVQILRVKFGEKQAHEKLLSMTNQIRMDPDNEL